MGPEVVDGTVLMDNVLLSAESESSVEDMCAWDVGGATVEALASPEADGVSDDADCPPSSSSSLPITRVKAS